MRNKLSLITIAALAIVTVLAASPAVADDSLASVSIGSSRVDWQPVMADVGMIMTISGPAGFVFREEFAAGDAPSFSLIDRAGNPLPDGSYTWELSPVVTVDAGTTAQMKSAREAGLDTRSGIEAMAIQSGYLTVHAGTFMSDAVEEPNVGPAPTGGPSLATKDFVIADDLIVDGSACIGFDCVNGESFGFDTIRLKENNLRIKFQDTSTSASFPSADWQLTANDSANGGANKFSIDDISGGRTPFTVEANAPSHSLYVDDGGRLGLGTSTPVVDVHVVSGNTPTLRLEQNGSSGFAPQTWDVAGNETNFFIRDASNGSTLPLRIRPGAPSNVIYVENDGQVGIGSTVTGAELHVRSTTAGENMVLIENTGSTAEHELLRLSSNGIAALYMEDTSASNEWKQTVQPGGVQITKTGTGAAEFLLDNSGNLTVQGTVTPMSDRNAKEAFLPIDPADVLKKVASLPLTTWKYKNDAAGIRHLGPMAQDFRAAFGLGKDDKGIAITDLAGTSLAAVQALHTMVSERDTVIETLKAEKDELAARLAALEEMVQTLVENNQ